MNAIAKDLKTSLDCVDIVNEIFSLSTTEIELEGFEPVESFKENGIDVYITNEHAFIAVLKEIGRKGIQRTRKRRE